MLETSESGINNSISRYTFKDIHRWYYGDTKDYKVVKLRERT
jgi:hypothetical protein